MPSPTSSPAWGHAACNEIWVAEGVYRPTPLTTDRSATFTLKYGVALYGGFNGTETQRSQRSPAVNLTVLSGDIDNNDSQAPVITDLATVSGNATNSYQVLNGADGATLDGFTITAGYADGESGTGDNSGGGMYNMYACPLLENLVFSGNYATDGGALYMYANYEPYSPALTNVSFQNNSAKSYGGGMYLTNQFTGTPALTNVTFQDNSAKMGGGGLYNSSSNAALVNVSFTGNQSDYGGGIYNNSADPTMTDVTFSGNQANGYGGGLYNQFGDLVMTRVIFDGNSAVGAGYGGGMHNYHSNVTMVNVTFNENTAVYGGGMTNYYSTPTLTSVPFTGNTASQDGGGLYDQDSNPIFTTALFSGNTAGNNGGGIFDSASSPALTDVIFNGNSAQNSGGGMFTNGGSPVLAKVTFKDNTAVKEGGGMAVHSAPTGATLTNVTFSGNSAGNAENAGIGGGMLIKAGSSGSPVLTYITLSGNSATSAGGGIYAMDSAAPVIKNTILWGNSAVLAGSQVFNETGAASTLEDSVIQFDCPIIGSTCTNIITADPLLGTLGEYGGFTQTIPLQAGSSAIDAANDDTCLGTDQRGVLRPQGPKCDIGAYEAGVFLPTLSGNAGAAYVTITWTGGSMVSSWLGDYKFSVPDGWTGTVTPSKPGYTFTPEAREYTALAANMSAQDYTAAPVLPILVFLPLVYR